MSDDDFTTNNWVWVPDKSEVFVRGYISEYLENGIVKVTVKNGAQEVVQEVDHKLLENCNPPKFNKCNDMAELTHLNEPSVIYNLFLRYNDDMIYTYSGLFLVAINPYKKLPIYEPAVLNKFHVALLDERLPPHIFAIAENTYRNLVANKKDQSILVTGESGAGKTENTKKIIQYLSSISTSADHHDIHEKILRANPILEAFGNAKTIKNNNSSRFGKFIKIFFEGKGLICGATIEYYLLEKSRVLHQLKDERNYHAFYQLLKGIDEKELREKYNLTPQVLDYKYLSLSNGSVPQVDDSRDFRLLREAFEIMGFSEVEVESIFTCLAVILHLGNVDFLSWKSEQANFSQESRIDLIATMLGVGEDDLSKNLLRPKVKAGREFVQKLQRAAEVKNTLDAFAKHLYEKIFEHIIARINLSLLAEETTGENFIGVLDIAGFEIFEVNSFEQLCINYTNEKLQQFFNHHSFILEQSEYLREDIQWEFIDFGLDLQPTIDLIEAKRPMGVLEILNEQCILPKASEETFMNKLLETWGNGESKTFRPNKVRSGFIINHYAGLVDYNIENWLLKNTDPVSNNILQLLQGSSNNFICKLFTDDEHLSSMLGKTPKLKTVSQKHKEQLSFLMLQLESTEPHFVRCILPNLSKRPNKFDKELVLHQLRCNGVLEGIRIARAGYPNKMTFEEFFNRYSILNSSEVVFTKNMKTNSEIILKHIQLDPEVYKIGITKLFFKNGILGNLEELRDAGMKNAFTLFQTMARGQLARKEIKKQIAVIRASQVLARNFEKLDHLVNKGESPWLKLFLGLKPMLEESVKVLDSNEMNESLKKMNGKLKETEHAKVALKTENDSLKDRLTSLEDEIIKANAQMSDKADKLMVLERDQASKSTKVEEISRQLSEIKAVNGTLGKDKAELASKLEESKSNLQKLEDQVGKLTVELEENKQTSTKLQEEVTKLQNVKKEYERAQSKIAELENSTESLKATVAEKNNVSQSMIDDLKLKLKDFEEISSNYDISKKSAAELEAKYATITKELEASKGNALDLESKHSDIFKKFEEAKAEADHYKSVQNGHLSQISDLNTQNANHEKKSKELEDAIALVKADFEKKIENSLQDNTSELTRLRDQLTKANGKVEYLEGELREKKSGYIDLSKRHLELERKHEHLSTQLEESKSLENELWEEKNRSSRFLELLDEEKQKLSQKIKENSSLEKALENMKHEIQYLTRAKSEYLVQIPKLKEDIQTLQIKLQDKENRPPAESRIDPKTMEEFANLRLKLNESNASVRRERFENQKLSQEVSLLRKKVNDSFESPLKRSELRRSVACGEDLKISQVNESKFAVEIKNLTSRLQQEEANVARAENYAIELQKKLNKLQMSRGINGFTDYEVKFKAAQQQIADLEKKLGKALDISTSQDHSVESISRSSSIGTFNPYTGSGDFAKIYKDITKTFKVTREELNTSKGEVLRLKALLRDSEDELYELKKSNVKTSIGDYERELARVNVQNDSLTKKQEELQSSVKKYKDRSEEYYAKLELAESAVSISKRHEQQFRKELEEKTTELLLVKEEIRASEKVIKQLRLDKNSLDGQLAQEQHKVEQLTNQLKSSEEQLRYLNDNYSERKNTIHEHKEEIRSLHEDLKFKLEKETEIIKENKKLKIENDELARVREEVLGENSEVNEENERLIKHNDDLSTEVELLKNTKQVNERKLEQSNKQIEALKELIEENGRQIEELNRLNDNLKNAKTELEAKVADVEDQLKEANMNLTLVRGHNENLENDKHHLKEELEVVRKKWDKSDGQYKSARTDNLVTVQENETLKSVNEELKKKVGELEEKLYSNEQLKYLETNITKLNGKVDNLKQEIFDHESREQKLAKQIKGLEYENDIKNTQMKRYNDENFNYQNMIGQYKSKVEFLHQENSEKDLKIKAQERELAEIRERLLLFEKDSLAENF